jgi:hypothetical protein
MRVTRDRLLCLADSRRSFLLVLTIHRHQTDDEEQHEPYLHLSSFSFRGMKENNATIENNGTDGMLRFRLSRYFPNSRLFTSS